MMLGEDLLACTLHNHAALTTRRALCIQKYFFIFLYVYKYVCVYKRVDISILVMGDASDVRVR